VAKAKGFLAARFTARWAKTYLGLTADQQKGADKVVMAILKQQLTPGMRIKPVEPEKYYHEARINDGDWLIFRVDEGTAWFVDIVKHDDIGRYGKRLDRLA
jgi:hypothetical protein